MKKEDLIVGNEYYLTYTGKFCHSTLENGRNLLEEGVEAIFIGIIKISEGERERAIFYCGKNGKTNYIMFGTSEMDYVSDIKHIKEYTMEELTHKLGHEFKIKK